MAEIGKLNEKDLTALISMIPAKNKPLKESPNIKEIDGMLMSSMNVPQIAKAVKDTFGEDYHRGTFKRRRWELRESLKSAKATLAKEVAATAAEQKSLTYELRTLEQSAVEVMKLELDPAHPQAKAVKALREQIESFMRRSAELFGEIDFLGVLRYTINVQHLRVAKMLELEMQMGLPMRDNAENLRDLRESVKDGIEIYERLGLRPKFGDPAENLKANMGGELSNGVGLSERQKQLKAMVDEVKALPPELREKRSRELLLQMMNRVAPVDAKILEETNDKPNLGT